MNMKMSLWMELKMINQKPLQREVWLLDPDPVIRFWILDLISLEE